MASKPRSGGTALSLGLAAGLVLPAAALRAQVDFAHALKFPGGALPTGVLAGDFNGDGHADLATADDGGDSVSIFLGDGAAGFAPAQIVAVQDAPIELAQGDFDGDGDPDLAVGNYSSSTVSLLRNDGAGAFTLYANLPGGPGGGCDVPVVADFDDDGDLDIAVSNVSNDGNCSNDTVSVYLGDGAGGFPASAHYGVGCQPQYLALGDLDRDGDEDLVVSNFVGGSLSLLFGDGLGGFQARTDIPISGQPNGLVVGDVNGDQDPDIVVSNFSIDTISVLLGDGTGAFPPASQSDYPATAPGQYPRLGDLDADGDLDIVVPFSGAGSLAVYRNRGGGIFGSPSEYQAASGAEGCAVADFNEDSKPDVAVVTGQGYDGVLVYLGEGDGRLRGVERFPVGFGPSGLLSADFNGDGHEDIATADDPAGAVSVILGTGGGSFGPAQVVPLQASRPLELASGDFDEDGDLDLAVGCYGSGVVALLTNDGAGAFAVYAHLPAGIADFGIGAGADVPVIADFNDDTHLDLAVQNVSNDANCSNDTVTVYLGDGTGSFGGRAEYGVGCSPEYLAMGDLDRDGDEDLVVSNHVSGSLSLLFGDGLGGFPARSDIPVNGSPNGIAVGDLNGDSNPDIVSGNYSSQTISIYLGDGTGAFPAAEQTDYPASARFSQPSDPYLADLDADGDLDIVFTLHVAGTVGVYLNTGNGTFETVLEFEVLGFPVGLSVADFDEDGRLDLAVASPPGAPGTYVCILRQIGPPEGEPPAPPGTLYTWGENGSGQLGPAADETAEATPVPYDGLPETAGIVAGDKSSLALMADGTVQAWGYNANGQLGDGTTLSRSAPAPVLGLSGVVAIDAGGYTSIALRSDGTAWTWGRGGYGQLGNGAELDSSVPVQVLNLDRVVAVATGVEHCAAVRDDGTVWVWGKQNPNGGVQALPVQAAGISNVVAVSAGDHFTVALQADSTLWAWGRDNQGALGDGPGITYGDLVNTPAPVLGMADVVSFDCGRNHVLAARADGSVWAWGFNRDGQLGDGTTEHQFSPVQVLGIGSVIQVAGGGYHSLALKADGSLWSWGYGHVGQLGIGEFIAEPTPPQPVLIPPGVNRISADFLHSMAIRTAVSPPPRILEQPQSQAVCSGGPATLSVSVSGAVTSYQWRKGGDDLMNGGSVSGADTAALTLSAIGEADAGLYDVVLTYASGAVGSAAASLEVLVPPAVVSGPTGGTRVEGESHTFTVVASGSGPLSYQWRKDGENIPGAAADTYTVGPLTAADTGSYDVVVSGACPPEAVSAPATLVVLGSTTPPGEDVSVQPIDPGTGASPVTVTFSEVTEGGETTVTSSPTGPPPPGGFRVGQPPVFYDLSTTATFSGAVEVCFSYAGQSFGNESNLKLFHFEGGWVDVTTSLDTVNDVICGTVTVLSPFAVFEEGGEAPVITAVTGPTGPLALGSSATVSVSFTDADAGDSHTADFSWDDGSAGTTAAASGGTAQAAHTFAAAGVYSVTVTVTDSAGETASDVFEFVVIYDPSGGFVTGGGWIQSPAGAYAADPALTGKATFGFNSKYQPGANVPTGNTEFKLHFASFNFRSTDYQWLVVAGAKAQFKGTGTINGAGSYGFLLTARDGQASGGGGVDRFRIKVWDKGTAGEPVVYDNALGASDDIDQASPQALGGGSIVVHH
jgi:alpha-tubulin suppressor-like RCC1 family protein